MARRRSAGDPSEGPQVRAGAKVVGWMLFVLLLLAGALYATAYYVAGDKVPRGTTISGVAVGGLEPAAARAKLRAVMPSRLQRPVPLTYDERTRTVVPAKAGIGVDYEGSVVKAGGGARSWSPKRLWTYFAGGDDLDAVATVDQPLMDSALSTLSRGVGLAAREGTVKFQGTKPVAVYSKAGEGIDRTQTRALLISTALSPEPAPDQELPLTSAQPAITAEEVRRALTQFAKPAMSAPVVLKVAGRRIVVPPARIAPALAMIPEGSRLVPVVNGDVLMRSLRPLMTSFSTTPVSAGFHLVHGKPAVVPARAGISVNVPVLQARLPAVLTQRPGHRVLQVTAAVTEPTLSTKAARKLDVGTALGRGQAVAVSQQVKVLDRALPRVGNAVVLPGQTYSLTGLLGSFDRGRPWTGSALSLLGSSVYAAAYAAGIDHIGHTLSTVHTAGAPVGREVYLSGNGNVSFVNDTGKALYVSIGLAHRRLTATVWSTRTATSTVSVSSPYDVVGHAVVTSNARHCTPVAGSDGFTVRVSRTVTRGGVPTTDSYTQTYQPQSARVCTRPRHHH